MSVLLSIVIPVYNKEKYLKKCMNSVLNQTYQNFEVILVDDGSSDDSVQMCDRYAESDARVRVIHKPNGGVSTARNRGIEEARGQYITFLDSDDYIEPNMVELFVKAIEENDLPDLVFIREKSVNMEGKTIHINGEEPTGEIIVGDRKQAAQHIIGMQLNSMWGKSYRKDLVGQMRLVEGKKHGEDLLFNLQYLCKVKTMALVDEIVYSYVSNDDSITHETYNPHTIDEWYFKDQAEQLIREHFPEYEKLAMRRSFVARQSVLRLLTREKNPDEAVRQEAENYCSSRYEAVKNVLSKKERTEYRIYKNMRWLYPAFLYVLNQVKRARGWA